MIQKEEDTNKNSSSSSENAPEKDLNSVDCGRYSFQNNSPYSTRPSSQNNVANNDYDNGRKMSSPICVYYHSSQKFLSQLLERKTKETGYDLYKSGNYIDRDSFFNEGGLGEGSYSNINKFNNCGRNSYPELAETRNNQFNRLPFNNSLMHIQQDDKIDYRLNFADDYNMRKNKFQNFNSGNLNYGYMDFEGEIMQFNKNKGKIPKNNYNYTIPQAPPIRTQNGIYSQNNSNKGNQSNNTFNDDNVSQGNATPSPIYDGNSQLKPKLKKVTNTFKEKKRLKIFVEREGDWICSSCRNLNFAFRKVCNRCSLPKGESDITIKAGNVFTKIKSYE